MENYITYLLGLVVIIIGIFLIKKFVGCIVRTIITAVVIGIVAYLYFANS